MTNMQDPQTTSPLATGMDSSPDGGATRVQDVDLRDGERQRDDMRPDHDYREPYREEAYRERPFRGDGYRERSPYRGWDDDRGFERYRERDYGRYREPDHDRYREQDRGGESGFAEGASRFARHHIRTGETKEFFKTSEFFVALAAAATLIIAAAVQDTFDAPGMWRMFTAVAVAYILSRGIAKAGSSKKEPDNRRGSQGW
jgi:hypothetical protein